MITSDAVEQARRYLGYLNCIMKSGKKIFPRGEEVREISDLQLRVDPNFPFMTFPARRYNLGYFRKEMRWKLGASPYDESIKQYAKIWEAVQNPDGTFNSNYGQYWFGNQGGLWSVVTELIRDPDSRRAVIPMLAAKHMGPEVKDTVCTEGIGFRIRDGRLDCSVHMRSSDSVFGLGTDIPTFTFLWFLVKALVGDSLNRDLQMGEMAITAMSAHIYSRHYDMVNKMLEDGIEEFNPEGIPGFDLTAGEALHIVAGRGVKRNCPNNYHLEHWLMKD